jgi:hypothetical protein
MTYKFVGALRGITTSQPHVMTALRLGIAIGLATEIARKLIKRNAGYQGVRRVADVLWWTARRGGGVALFDLVQAKRAARRPQAATGSCRRT